MAKTTRAGHFVVDGSNIATEGRSLPSLQQLNEAVTAFMEDHPGSTITVVVDATFGHRIDKSEVAEFDEGVANNELVAPPAGAVGRGDAFVLNIAHKAGASILSNDSFQEFHGDYEWLFDDGRLIGGKPVPHVGWVFVPRVPVRGPKSRQSVREASKPAATRTRRTSKTEAPTAAPKKSGAEKSGGRSRGRSSTAKNSDETQRTARTASVEASQPMPVPKEPPPGSRSNIPSGDEQVNELMPFLNFVEHHPVGTSVNAIVETYSSHGAYVTIGDVRAYVPIRLMADPPPRSARLVMKIGEAVTLVVASYAAARRSIDCAMPAMADRITPSDGGSPADSVVFDTSADAAAPTKPKKRTSRAKATTPKQAAAKKTPEKQSGTERAAAKKVPTKKVAAKKSPAKKAAAKKAAAKRTPVKKAPAKKAAAKVSADKAPAKTASTKKAPAKKAAPKKVGAKKSTARKDSAN